MKIQGSIDKLVSWPANKQACQHISSLKLYSDSLVRDLHLSNIHFLFEQDSSGDEEDKDIDLECPFPTVIQTEIEETVVPPEQVRIVDLQDYAPSAEIDIENPDDIQQDWKKAYTETRCPTISGQSQLLANISVDCTPMDFMNK